MRSDPDKIIRRLLCWLHEAREAAHIEKLKRQIAEAERDQLSLQVNHYSKEVIASSRRLQASLSKPDGN